MTTGRPFSNLGAGNVSASFPRLPQESWGAYIGEKGGKERRGCESADPMGPQARRQLPPNPFPWRLHRHVRVVSLTPTLASLSLS